MKKLFFPLLLVLASLLVFSNVYENSFQLDDYYLIKNNPGIHKVSPITRHFTDPTTISRLERITQYRPMLPLSMSISYYFSGDSLAGYHAGAGAVQKYGGVPPYTTTRAYVKAVLRRYYAYERQAQFWVGNFEYDPVRLTSASYRGVTPNTSYFFSAGKVHVPELHEGRF